MQSAGELLIKEKPASTTYKSDFAPVRSPGVNTQDFPWEGSIHKKPWDYTVTVAIPTLDTPETLPTALELLRLQSIKPYILIIDTGSLPVHVEKLKKMQAEDCEVHFLRLNGVQHPSDFPAMAMDVAFTLCRTEYLFATHADCYLKKQTLFEEWIQLAKTIAPVIGYEITPRAHDDWHGMVSHTATLYHMPTMDCIGMGWSMRRLCNYYGIKDYRPNPNMPNFPDTEVLSNYILRQNNIKPHLVGSEQNFCRQNDENIDHFRSYTSSKLYDDSYYAQAFEWFQDAVNEAKKRITEWKNAKQEKKGPQLSSMPGIGSELGENRIFK